MMSRHGGSFVLLAAALALAVAPAVAQAPGPATVPFAPGVVLNYVMHNYDEPDRQFFSTIVSVGPEETVFEEEMTYEDPGGKRQKKLWRRTVTRLEMKNSRKLDHGTTCHPEDAPEDRQGTILRMASQKVLRRLKTEGEADFTLGYVIGCSPVFWISGVVRRVEPGPVVVPVLLDGQRLDLPTVHARGRFANFDTRFDQDFWFLDDPERAWMMRNEGRRSDGKTYLMQLGTIATPDAESERRLERQLEQTCRAAVYGIYFDTASAELSDTSRPTVQQVAALLARHPSWTLTVEGHTDSIGGAAFNLDLSQRRAAAVKAALVGRHGIAASRLLTKGYGLARPVEGNETIAGRARNRRVELSRACS